MKALILTPECWHGQHAACACTCDCPCHEAELDRRADEVIAEIHEEAKFERFADKVLAEVMAMTREELHAAYEKAYPGKDAREEFAKVVRRVVAQLKAEGRPPTPQLLAAFGWCNDQPTRGKRKAKSTKS
jgi:hypothetical protein